MSSDPDWFDTTLTSSDDAVARLPRPAREERIRLLTAQSHLILDQAIHEHISEPGKTLAGVVGLFSGGNDSTVLAHLMRPRLSHLAHANTTIGIEATRVFVRDTAAAWGVPLLEFTPERDSDHYPALVRDQGFPGPGHHFKMYQRLKERSLRRVRRHLVTERHQRVVFLAGRRRAESQRRMNIPVCEREGSIVWVSPMVNWTKPDLNTYRLLHEVPVNEVTDLLHMSGECLCGAFAHAGELDEIAAWFPGTAEDIRALEAEIADREDIPEHRKTWGWGATVDPATIRASKVGALCSSCDARYTQTSLEDFITS